MPFDHGWEVRDMYTVIVEMRIKPDSADHFLEAIQTNFETSVRDEPVDGA
jgi:quinol monooxygenase YgiN